MLKRRDLLQSQGGTDHHPTVAQTLQHRWTTQCVRLPPASAGDHRPDGPKANHTLTLKLDQSMGAGQNMLSINEVT